MVDVSSLLSNKVTIAGIGIPLVFIAGLGAFFLLRRGKRDIKVRIG